MIRSLTSIRSAAYSIVTMAGFAVFAIGLLTFGQPANAQTPDGETPALESVCDGLETGLFGICNAYCEAMDCDNPERVKANGKACQSQVRKWATIAGDDPLPCSLSASISLTKSVNTDGNGEIVAGDELIYTFIILNDGDVPVTILSLVD